MIRVVGLGVDEDQITLAGVKAIEKSKKVYVKTALTETFKYFDENNIEVTTFDYLYNQAEDFSDLDSQMVDILLQEKDVCLCVNGSGFDDRTVIELQKRTKVEIYPSVALGSQFVSPALFTTKLSAYDIKDLTGFNYDTQSTLIIVDIDNLFIASEVKLVLSNILGDDQEIRFNDKIIKVYEIDRQNEYDYKSTIIVEPIEITKKKRFNFEDLYKIMRILRSENGCEWDKVQTHESIRENIIEEAYELVEAINNEDVENMIEESGDLFLQSIFQCVIGEDMGQYNAEDALSAICQKLIFRHPHVFGEIKATNAEEALRAWDAAKAQEKHYDSQSAKMDKVTKSLPALMKAAKIVNIAKKAGEKISKEEVIDLLKKESTTLFENEDENTAGALLLTTILLLKFYDVNPEVALDKATNKLIDIFKKSEEESKAFNILKGINEDL